MYVRLQTRKNKKKKGISICNTPIPSSYPTHSFHKQNYPVLTRIKQNPNPSHQYPYTSKQFRITYIQIQLYIHITQNNSNH